MEDENCTYVAQILHYIVKLVTLLEFIADLLDSFFHNEVFGNFRPHSVFLRFFRFKTSSLVSGVNDSEFPDIFFLTVLATTDTIQGAATTCFTFEYDVLVIMLAITRATVGTNISQSTFKEINMAYL